MGEGWEGVTYMVRDRLDGRTKAIKFITNARREKSILSQARVMVRLHHPNIINYYTVDQLETPEGKHFFLLLEYLHGPRLSQVIEKHFKRHDQPRLFWALRIFRQICDGMAYVHKQKLLHDDLHTDNIILTGDSEAPVPKLFDFWGSRVSTTRTDRRFDLKCAGLVLYELLTGREDYEASELEWLPPEVAAIIRKTHARVHTYRNFDEMLLDIDDLRDWD